MTIFILLKNFSNIATISRPIDYYENHIHQILTALIILNFLEKIGNVIVLAVLIRVLRVIYFRERANRLATKGSQFSNDEERDFSKYESLSNEYREKLDETIEEDRHGSLRNRPIRVLLLT